MHEHQKACADMPFCQPHLMQQGRIQHAYAVRSNCGLVAQHNTALHIHLWIGAVSYFHATWHAVAAPGDAEEGAGVFADRLKGAGLLQEEVQLPHDPPRPIVKLPAHTTKPVKSCTATCCACLQQQSHALNYALHTPCQQHKCNLVCCACFILP